MPEGDDFDHSFDELLEVSTGLAPQVAGQTSAQPPARRQHPRFNPLARNAEQPGARTTASAGGGRPRGVGG